jgi:hypothetical protein
MYVAVDSQELGEIRKKLVDFENQMPEHSTVCERFIAVPVLR